ncbi:hypothetical protein R70723_12695 [Paenibacillus sp. FSL R7-0273]|nr:hypothetical protein R70723_12695 [Paenibacillus sp. FSL R7-0273]OMF97828.1 hypothetical protein BK144_02875 [Paenibacillus sp. FSL R7-0273]
MLVVLCLAIAVICMAYDRKLLKGRGIRRDRIVYMLFWAAGISSAVCALLRVNIPSPLLLIIMIYKPFNTIVGSWFQ